MELGSSLKVLVVDDQSAVRAVLAAQLDQLGHQVIEAHDAEWALEQFARYRPDLVLLDVVMPGHDGYWLAREIRRLESGDWTPIVFLSAQAQDQDLWRGIECGGDDYLVKPVAPMVLGAKLRAMQRLRHMQQRLVELSAELRTANARLHDLSEIDPLTGIFNRRALDRLLHEEIAAARRSQEPLTLFLCDVDVFKAYNDRLGHVAGDECLQHIARLLRDTCQRPRDRAARYGGEEFALLLPNTPKSGAMTFARALRRVFQTAALPHPASPAGPLVTLSGGITTCVPTPETTGESMVLRADQALYTAKAQGRDRFFSFEMQMDTFEQRAA